MWAASAARARPDGRPGRGDRKKTPVFGMVERGGRVVASKVPDASALSLMPQIEKRVLSESVVFTDEWKSYNRLARSGYQHRRIHHSQEVYVVATCIPTPSRD